MAGPSQIVMPTLATISEIPEDQVCKKTLPEIISLDQTQTEENELDTKNVKKCDPQEKRRCTFSDTIGVYHTSEEDTESPSMLVMWAAVFNWDDFCYALISGFLPTARHLNNDLCNCCHNI